LGDITLRAIDILKNAELIACEDTRKTAFLLQQYKIPVPKLISFHKFNERSRQAALFAHLESGKDLVVVSDAGSPGISDPCESLVAEALIKGIEVIALPGASAVIPAISVSGFSTRQFQFVGFLPAQAKKRREKLHEIKDYPFPTVIYEAPHRIITLLQELLNVLGDRKLCLCREISKLHEEHIYGLLSELISNDELTIKGEFCLVLDGTSVEQTTELDKGEPDPTALHDFMIKCKKAGMGTREISVALAEQFGLERKTAYSMVVKHSSRGKKA
jgi:16S rRNA (cytidine1402-2'-O)-methyltransferase